VVVIRAVAMILGIPAGGATSMTPGPAQAFISRLNSADMRRYVNRAKWAIMAPDSAGPATGAAVSSSLRKNMMPGD